MQENDEHSAVQLTQLESWTIQSLRSTSGLKWVAKTLLSSLQSIRECHNLVWSPLQSFTGICSGYANWPSYLLTYLICHWPCQSYSCSFDFLCRRSFNNGETMYFGNGTGKLCKKQHPRSASICSICVSCSCIRTPYCYQNNLILVHCGSTSP